MEQITQDLQAQSLTGNKRTAEVADLNQISSAHQKKSIPSSESEVRAILADKRRGPHRKDRQIHRWTPEEDKLLQDAVAKHGAKNWKLVASLVEGRDHTQCLQRWSKCLAPGLRKGTWTLEEDELLTKCVHDQLKCIANSDNKNRKIPWGEVCKHIKGRTAKQCRERWVNNLDPVINKGAWSKEEDDNMTDLYRKYGPSWAAIAKEMNGRTENGVKIRWKTLSRTKAGILAQAAAPAPVFEKPVKSSKGSLSSSRSTISDSGDDNSEKDDSDKDSSSSQSSGAFTLTLRNSTGMNVGVGGSYFVNQATPVMTSNPQTFLSSQQHQQPQLIQTQLPLFPGYVSQESSKLSSSLKQNSTIPAFHQASNLIGQPSMNVLPFLATTHKESSSFPNPIQNTFSCTPSINSLTASMHSPQQNILSPFPQQQPQGFHSQSQSFSLSQQFFSPSPFPSFIHHHSNMFFQPPYSMQMMIDGKGSATDFSQSQDHSFSNLSHMSSFRSNSSSISGSSTSESDTESKKHIAANLNLTSFDSSSSLHSFPSISIASHFSEPKITDHHGLPRTDSGCSGVWTAPGKSIYRKKDDDDETSSIASQNSAYTMSSADLLGNHEDTPNFVVQNFLQVSRNSPASSSPFFPLAGQDSKRSVS